MNMNVVLVELQKQYTANPSGQRPVSYAGLMAQVGLTSYMVRVHQRAVSLSLALMEQGT